jgi:hypothetical protein
MDTNDTNNDFLNTPHLETSEHDGASSRNFSAEKYPCSRGGVFKKSKEKIKK